MRRTAAEDGGDCAGSSVARRVCDQFVELGREQMGDVDTHDVCASSQFAAQK
jgi:hypothetical protein